MQGIIADSPIGESSLPLNSIQVTSVQSCPHRRLAVCSPTHEPTDFYLEFSRKAGLVPKYLYSYTLHKATPTRP